MRPCDRCGTPVENDILQCVNCSETSPVPAADVACGRLANGPRNDSPEQWDDSRFFAIGYAATFALCVILCCKLFSYLQWPTPFAVALGLVIAFVVVGVASEGLA